MRVSLDTNILFSAAKSDGAVRALLRLLPDREHELVADASVVAEARSNLPAKGSHALRALEALLPELRLVATVPVSAVRAADVQWLPEKYRPVLAAAIRSKCDALVSGDRTHFGRGYGRVYGGVVILSPRSLAERLFVRFTNANTWRARKARPCRSSP